jgi:site-specific recombinase XerD
MSQRQYQRIRTVPPDFWTPDLRQVFDLWVQDMRCGMRPYTDRTVQTFERRFILYTRRGWEGKADSLSLAEVFKLTNVYSIISQYPVESYSNRHNMLYSLISFAKFLIALGLLEEEVLQRLRKLRPRRVTPARKTVLRQESDIAQMRHAIQTKRYEAEYSRILDHTMFETFIRTGLRVAELSQLNLEDVDFANGSIHVQLGKGRKSRKVGLLKGLAPILKDYLDIRHRRVTKEHKAFFLNRRGTRIKTADITRRLLKLSKLAGLSITAHGLRRTFATQFASQGKPLHLIQLALGHSDIRTTQEYLMSDEAQVIQAMQEW